MDDSSCEYTFCRSVSMDMSSCIESKVSRVADAEVVSALSVSSIFLFVWAVMPADVLRAFRISPISIDWSRTIEVSEVTAD